MFRFMRALSHVAHRLSYDICHVFYMTFVMIHMFDSIDINDNVARRVSRVARHAHTQIHTYMYVCIALRCVFDYDYNVNLCNFANARMSSRMRATFALSSSFVARICARDASRNIALNCVRNFARSSSRERYTNVSTSCAFKYAMISRACATSRVMTLNVVHESLRVIVRFVDFIASFMCVN